MTISTDTPEIKFTPLNKSSAKAPWATLAVPLYGAEMESDPEVRMAVNRELAAAYGKTMLRDHTLRLVHRAVIHIGMSGMWLLIFFELWQLLYKSVMRWAGFGS